MTRDQTVKTEPGFWMHETSGVLAPVVTRYLKGDWLSHDQVVIIRAYLRQWMQGPWIGEGIQALREEIDQLHTRSDIEQWVERASEFAIDPF